MSHYDMNLCYIDELLRHLAWTGDREYARKIFPVIERHLAWEKRNFDPDGDHLYDAYCCIWASDALYYSGGAVTHSTAYNYYANRKAAEIAALLGLDPAPYRAEADAILEALNATLWMDDRGHWAECKDLMGHARLHPDAALWTIYHAIDSETADPFQAYAGTSIPKFRTFLFEPKEWRRGMPSFRPPIGSPIRGASTMWPSPRSCTRRWLIGRPDAPRRRSG